MAYPDSPGWPDPSDRGHDDSHPGRQRARHVDAAPDAYPGPRSNSAWDAGLDLGLHPDVDRTPRERGRHAAADDPFSVQGGTQADRPGEDPAHRSGEDPAPTSDPYWVDSTATSELAAVTGTAPGGPDEASPVEAADVSEASPAPEPAKSSGRAGRNLPAAIGVGVTLGAVVLASLFLWRPAFLGVVIVAMVIATWEMVRAVRTSGIRPPMAPLIAGGVAMAGLAWYGGAEALVLGLVATAVAALVWRLADGPARYQRDVVAALLIAVYVPFLGGFAVLLLRPEDGALRVLAALAGVVLSDTGGYIAGVFFGKRPMAPSVSPKKSWEGTAGSLLAAAAGGALMLYLMFDVAWWYGALFGLAVAAASVLGDLAESLIKRDLGIKDMSSLLPGHGGLMDRLDSILFALPTAVAVLAFVAPVLT
jgi:phosphatidate cytidylyltransferase